MSVIDIGGSVINRANAYGPQTVLSLENPANASGVLTAFEIWCASGATGVKVGTFSGSGTSYDDRDVETIGSVTGGSKQTFTGKSCDVVTGDFVGCYFSAGSLEADTSGYGGVAYAAGDKFGSGVNTYTVNAITGVSIAASGFTPPPARSKATLHNYTMHRRG